MHTTYTPEALTRKIAQITAKNTGGPTLILHPYIGRRDGDEFDRANAADGYTEPFSADYHERDTLTQAEQAEGLTIWHTPDREYTPEISDYAADVHVCTDKNSAREILRALRIRDQARTAWHTARTAHDTASMAKAAATGKAAQRAADQAIARHDDAAMRYAINGSEAHRAFLLSMDDAPPAAETPAPLHIIENEQGSDGDDHGPQAEAEPIQWQDNPAQAREAARRDGHLWSRCPLNHHADPNNTPHRDAHPIPATATPGTTTPSRERKHTGPALDRDGNPIVTPKRNPLHVTEPEANTPDGWADQWQILGDIAAITVHDPGSEQAKECARQLRDATRTRQAPETVAAILATFTVPQYARA